jgi:hypothetical protein
MRNGARSPLASGSFSCRANGRILVALLHPLQICACHGRIVPCVHDPIALLRDWNDGEYRDTDLAFPSSPITPARPASPP